MQQLKALWEQYSATHHGFNLSVLPEEIKKQGVRITYQPQSVIVSRGTFPEYIYFIESGTALGTRHYDDGNSYYYFEINMETGAIGLLEILAREPKTVATIVASTEVTILRISSAIVYQYLMTHPDILIRCTFVVAHDLYQRSANDGLLYYLEGIDRVRYYLVQYYMLHANGQEMLAIAEDYQTISSNIGVSSRTVGRSIQKLKENGEITSIRKKIHLSYDQFQAMTSHVNKILHSGI